MDLEVLTEQLYNVVRKSERVSGRNLTLPVLNCLLLEAKNNHILIKATNLDLGIEGRINCKVKKEGRAAIPTATLGNFLGNIQDSKTIHIKQDGDNLIIETQKNSSVIKTIPNDDFPNIPKIKPEVSFKIDPKNFINGLKSVFFSASSSSIKPELASVMVEHKNDILHFVATDSFRLAEKRVSDKNIRDDFNPILLPFKNIPEIIRVLEEETGPVKVLLDKNQISFEIGDIYLFSRIIDGTFPDYKQLLPKEFKTEVVVLKQDFTNTLKLSLIFSDKFNKTTFRIKPKNKIFEIETKNPDIGENKTKVDASLTGDDIEINFNHRYITDCLASIGSDSLSLNLNEIGKPMVIKGVNDNSFTYLVMPMNR